MNQFLHFSSRLKCLVTGEDKGQGCVPHCLEKPVPSWDTDSINVLIIEDEEAHFLLMKRAIEKKLPQASVHHFNNGATCIDEVDRIVPDVVILDYLMPGMNGLELLRSLRQTGRTVPVIMITGQGDESIAVQAMKLGAQDYLVKSADFFMLVPCVIGRVVREEKLKHFLRRGVRLNELLLESLPYPAMLVGRDRVILAANRIAKAMGAQVGQCCWMGFSHNNGRTQGSAVSIESHGSEPRGEESPCPCPFCMADRAFQTRRAANLPEVDTSGRLWDMWWIPIDGAVCLHYAIDVTERKRTELALRTSGEQLRLLSARLIQAQEDERKRISREMHDSIGSSLSAIKMFLESTVAQMRQGDTNPDRLVSAIDMTQDIIAESRRIMMELRPTMLDDLGIVAALGWLCRNFRKLHPHMQVHEQIAIEESAVPEPLKIVILRIVQEAFHNITKYSRARNVGLSLSCTDDSVGLAVKDDGIGFDIDSTLPGKDLTGGLGLASMKERTELSGGTFRIMSRKGDGTAISASWP